jgi:TalC/MipB family fructose-6-phosphate aldolase
VLRIYLDSADREAVTSLLATGLFAGVTTNPLILERAGVASADIPTVHAWAVEAGAREVFLQTWGSDVAAMLERAEQLVALGPRVVLKVPATPDGFTVTARLTAAGHRVLVTAVYTVEQALMSEAAGASFIAPYVGRMDDAGLDGVGTVLSMQRALTGVGGSCEVLAASLRGPEPVRQLAEGGVPCFTLAPAVAASFLDVESSRAAAADFERAASGAAKVAG